MSVRHHLADTWTLFLRELLRYRRERAYWAGQLLFPLGFVGFIGFGLDRVTDLPSGTSYVAHIGSGMLALLIGSGAVGGGFSLIEDRDTGFLRALLIAPVSRTSIVLGKLLARGAASLVLVAVLIAVMATFTPLTLVSPGAVVVAILGITSIFAAMGVWLASRLRRVESFRTLAALITVPLYLFSGIFYPIETLPTVMQGIAYVNPLTYGLELLRYGLLGVSARPVLLSTALLFTLGGLGVWVSIRSFDRSARG